MAPGPTAEVWYGLFTLYTSAAIIINAVIMSIFVILLLKYRASKAAEEGGQIDAKKLALVFVVLSAVIFYSLEFYTLSAMDFIETPPEDIDMVIEVQGLQWTWKFIYPNGTESIGTLRIPRGTTVLFKVVSLDVHHKFGIPDLKASIDAVPGQTNYLWVRFDQPGEYVVRCYELCGVGHANMVATIIVE